MLPQPGAAALVIGADAGSTVTVLPEAGAAGRLPVTDMEVRLQQARLSRRATEQAVKAAQHLHAPRPREIKPDGGAPEGSPA